MKPFICSLLFCLIGLSSSTYAQTTLEGKVTDANTGEPILFGTVVIYKNGVLVTGVETDLDGIYFFSDLQPGTYEVEASYIGYTARKYTGFLVESGKTNRLDFKLSTGVLMDAIEIVEYKAPLIEYDNTTSGATMTAEAIRSLPTKSVSASKAKAAGISSYDSRVAGSYPPVATNYKEAMPEAGQVTAGEWNDLHNWKDWMELLKNEDYEIMTHRYEIYPTNRFSVLVLNKNNNVLPNIKVALVDRNEQILWEGYTDNSGKAEMWSGVYATDDKVSYILVDDSQKINTPKTIEKGTNTITIDKSCNSTEEVDIAFMIDATSSMSDEISYLKSELLDVIDRVTSDNEDIDIRTGMVFYRDTNDEYLTRISPFTSIAEETISFLAKQYAKGGGDYPEAVDEGLEKILNMKWRDDAIKIAFLLLDAPPHEDEKTIEKIKSQIQDAASKGIKLIPVTASGINRETEFLMKFMAMLTNGTYVFITDDSGIGNPHLDPVVDDYEVEKLNDCLVRLISQYSKPYSCDIELREEPELEATINVYPNPATQFVNIETSTLPTKITLHSSNGMVVKTIKPTDLVTRLDLHDFVNGVYTISILYDDRKESRQIILIG